MFQNESIKLMQLRLSHITSSNKILKPYNIRALFK